MRHEMMLPAKKRRLAPRPGLVHLFDSQTGRRL